MTRRTISRTTLEKIAAEVTIAVPEMPATTLIRKSINHYNRRNPEKRPATVDSAPDFLARLAVNYLRHQHSSYDSTRNALRDVATKSDRDFVGAIIKGRVLRQIALTYPMLRSEAQKQAHREDATVNGASKAATRISGQEYAGRRTR